MIKAGIDQDAIAKMFSEATAKQGEALRKAVSDATLKALQGRELTMENIKKVLKTVTTAATAGAGKNVARLGGHRSHAGQGRRRHGRRAAEGRRGESQGTPAVRRSGRGAAGEAAQEGAIANLEKMEDTFFVAVGKAVESAASVPLQGPWKQVLDSFQTKGSDSGARATQTAQDLLEQAKAALRGGRASSAKATQAMLDGYAALVSGVLIGMSEGLQGGSVAPRPGAKTSKKTRRRVVVTGRVATPRTLSNGRPDPGPHAVRGQHHLPHPVPDHQHRHGLGAAVLPAALAEDAPRGRPGGGARLARRLPLLDQGVRAELRARRGQRHHDELPVRHQLAGLHGEGRQHRRAAARLRSADGVLPRSRLPRRDAVRPRQGQRARAPDGDLLRRVRHHAVARSGSWR